MSANTPGNRNGCLTRPHRGRGRKPVAMMHSQRRIAWMWLVAMERFRRHVHRNLSVPVPEEGLPRDNGT
jgi:hypothetical protein